MAGRTDLNSELNDIWNSMNELVELCKLMRERVNVTTRKLELLDKRIEEVELCVKNSKTLAS